MKAILSIALMLGGSLALSHGASFVTPVSISSSTSATDLWPVSNLIQGPGVGYDSADPHAKTLGGPDGNWVTDAPGGFPADFIAVAGMPILTLDLGSDTLLGEISIWGYASTNANGVSAFSLRFATDAEGTGGFGSSITYNPTFFPTNDDTVRQSFDFSENVTARFVEFKAVDNFFIAPGDGSGGETPGGDRVGLGEIAFEVTRPGSAIPEPSRVMMAMLALGAVTLGTRGRRRATE